MELMGVPPVPPLGKTVRLGLSWLPKEKFHNDCEMSKCCKMRAILV